MGDVTIRGAGIFGLSIAWACVQRGAEVTLVDCNGAGSGSSGGLVGALAPHVPENWNAKKDFQFQSLMMAQSFWDTVTKVGGLSPGYGRTGRLQPIADDRALDLASARSKGAQDLWQGKAQWQVVSETNHAGWAPLSPSGYLIHDTLTARMNPRRAGAALVAALAAKGVRVQPSAPDRGAVIWATGVADLNDMTTRHRRTVGNGVKGQSALLDYDAGTDAPQIFADGIHIIPHDGGGVAIGSTSEREFDNPSSTDDQLDAVIDKARAILPALADAPVLTRWAGVRPRTRSRAPMLGRHPFRAGQYVANGGFKIGFGMAPKVAEVMADLVLEGRDTIPDDFKPEASL